MTAKVAREKDIFNSESHKSTWRVQEAASLTAQVNKRISVLYFLADVNGTPPSDRKLENVKPFLLLLTKKIDVLGLEGNKATVI